MRQRHLPHPWVLADQIRDLVGYAADNSQDDLSEIIAAAAKLCTWLDLFDTTPEHAGHLEPGTAEPNLRRAGGAR